MNVVLLESGSGWEVFVDGQPTSDENAPSSAESPTVRSIGDVVDKLKSLAANNKRSIKIAIAANSSRFLFNQFQKPPGRLDHNSLVYEFEAALPVAAEDFECDFQTNNTVVSGIALPHAEILSLVQDLEDNTLPVHSISCAALLALQSWQKETGISDGIVVWQHDAQHGSNGRADLFELSEKRIANWRHLSSDPAVLQQEISAVVLQSDSSPKLHVLNGAADIVAVGTAPPLAIESQDLKQHAVVTANRVLAGKADPWFEFRQGKLTLGHTMRAYEKPLQIALLAATILLAVLSFAFWKRDTFFQQQATHLQEQQRSRFSELFPDEEPPRDILARLEDEARLRRAGGSQQESVAGFSQSALYQLNEFMRRLPTQLNLNTELLKVTPDAIELNGTVPNSTAATSLVESLRNDGQFDVRETIQRTDSGAWSVLLVIQNRIREESL